MNKFFQYLALVILTFIGHHASARQLSDSAKAKELYQAGLRCINVENFDSALVYFVEASEITNLKPNFTADISYQLGLVYKAMTIYDNALDCYLKALRLYESSKNVKQVIKLKNSIAALYSSMGYHLMGLKYSSEAISMVNRHSGSYEFDELLAFSYNNKAIALQNLNTSDSALIYYEKSLKLKLKSGSLLSASYTYNNIATIYSEKKQYDSALINYKKSLTIKKQLKNQTGIANSFTNIGQLYNMMGRYGLAVKYQDSAILFSLSDLALKVDIYANLASLYSNMDKHTMAYDYLKRSKSISDSIKNRTIDEKLAKLQRVYDIEKRERQINLANSRLKILESEVKIKNNRLIITIVLILLLISVACLFWIYFRAREKRLKSREAILLRDKQISDYENEKLKSQQLDLLREKQIREYENDKLIKEKQLKDLENQNLLKDIEIKNRELSLITLQSVHKKELVVRLKEGIELSRGSGGNKAEIEKMSALIENILNFDDDWSVFKEHFENTHAEFFKRLVSGGASLTETDLKHCCYIRIGLNTKEIATLLNISPLSVQKSRVRLKKKLLLGREVDLLQFIKSI